MQTMTGTVAAVSPWCTPISLHLLFRSGLGSHGNVMQKQSSWRTVWDNPAWCVGILEFPLSSADHKSPSRSSGLDRSESMLYAGSTSQLNGGGNAYLPDYSVRQLTPLQIIKVPSGCRFSHNSPALTRGSAVLPVTLCPRSPAATTRTQ